VYQSSQQLGQDDVNVRDAVRFGLGVGAIAMAFVAVAAVWVSTCTGTTADTLACGVPQRTVLAIGAPIILLLGGLRAFHRTYQARRRHESTWAWQGAGWFLLTLMLLMVTMSMPGIAGPAVFGG
jgi:hypothetical protein